MGTIIRNVAIAGIVAIALLFAVTNVYAFEKAKVSNCELREYGIRIGYLVGPRVPLVIPLRKANSEEVFSDFFKAMSGASDIDFIEKYAYKEDVERAEREYRETLIGHLGINSELVNNVFYGGQWIAPMRIIADKKTVKLRGRVTNTPPRPGGNKK